MKIKLTNYDNSNYKLLEKRLNELSSQGYNCKNVDFFTIFKRDNQRYYYKTAIFIPNKNNSLSRRQQRDQWLRNYIDKGYEFIGKIHKIYIFKATKKISMKDTSEQYLLEYFKKNKTLANIFYIFISALLTLLLVPNAFYNNTPEELITNGAIFIHYSPVILCAALLFRFINNYIQCDLIKNALKDKKKQAISNKSEYAFILSNWLFIAFFIIFFSGFALDSIQRYPLKTNDDLINLTDFNMQKANDFEGTYTSSFLINKSYNYIETNGNEIITANYYIFSSKNQAEKYLNNYINNIYFKNKKDITSGYLIKTDQTYDQMVFVDNNKLIILKTNFDLLENDLYKQIKSS